MDQYIQVLAFSNDLISYIGEKIDVPTEDFLCQSDFLTERSRFTSAIGEAIWGLTTKLARDTIRQMALEMEERLGEGENEAFAQLAMRAAVEYFPKGYGHCEFFAFCAAVVGVAVRLYQKEDPARCVDEMVFEMAAGVIGTVLIGHVVVSKFDCSEKAWREMSEVAEKFNEANGL